MQTPLVSVITPCYNAAESLPWALASMLAQTYVNWELVVVDDGSTDGSAEVVEAVGDSRIRLIRFPGNRGRPYARQAALDAAGGKYLAMLDADDWIYPEKLARQVEVMEAYPEIPVVSAGMMVLDRSGKPVGVRGHGPAPGVTTLPPFGRLGRPPVSHGPTMLRMDEARGVAYDTRLTHSEDTDFLLCVMLGKPYALLGEALYVYAEHESVTEAKVLRSLACNRRIYQKYRKSHPIASSVRLLETVGKEVVYRGAFALGLHNALLRRRSTSPTPHQLQDYHRAYATVAGAVGAIASVQAQDAIAVGHG